MRGLLSAIRILTAVPVPGRDAGFSAAALPWFPVVGAALGATCWALAMAVGPRWPEGAAILSVALGVILTGGLHLDGLADTADGLGGGRDTERALAIMKDSRTGAFGAIAITLALIARTLATTRLIVSGAAVWLIASSAIARLMQIDLMVRLPSARPDGTAAALVNGARWSHWILGLMSCAIIALPLCGTLGAAALIGAFFLNFAMGSWFKRRIGGVTGDLLGAASEISETCVLLCAAFLDGKVGPHP